MKLRILLPLIAVCFLTACIKNDPVLWSDTKVEWDITSWNANAAGVNYPVMAQVPPGGRAVATDNANCNAATVDPFITRTSGTITIRVNLVGAQTSADRTIGFKVIPVAASVPTLLFRKRTPACGDVLLTLQDAVEGTHFSFTGPRLITIPANSSFGTVTINILNPGATAGLGRVLGLELDETGDLKPSVNYARVGLSIDQR